MIRPHQLDYAGAVGRLSLDDALRLDRRRFALQPKIDGQYVRISLDARGCIARLFSRTGAIVPAGDLEGAFIGWPHSQLVGELEAHTESGNRAAARRGYRCIHLFDCLRSGGVYIAGEPYRTRRDHLLRMQSEVVNLGLDAPWLRDARGDFHSPATGRYIRPVPHGWRRAPVVEQVRSDRAGELWDRIMGDGGEGLVAVALDAPVGRRGAKRKIKPVEHLDCTVVSRGPSVATVEYGGQIFAVSIRGHAGAQVGSVVEVAHEGWYERQAVPRFPRVRRVRDDL